MRTIRAVCRYFFLCHSSAGLLDAGGIWKCLGGLHGTAEGPAGPEAVGALHHHPVLRGVQGAHQVSDARGLHAAVLTENRYAGEIYRSKNTNNCCAPNSAQSIDIFIHKVRLLIDLPVPSVATSLLLQVALNTQTENWKTQFGPRLKTEVQHFYGHLGLKVCHISGCMVIGLSNNILNIAESPYCDIIGIFSHVSRIVSWGTLRSGPCRTLNLFFGWPRFPGSRLWR